MNSIFYNTVEQDHNSRCCFTGLENSIQTQIFFQMECVCIHHIHTCSIYTQTLWVSINVSIIDLQREIRQIMALQLISNYEHHLITDSLEKNSFSYWFDSLKIYSWVPKKQRMPTLHICCNLPSPHLLSIIHYETL